MTQSPGPGLKTAVLDWRDPQTPVSSQFQDVYFSKVNGLEETRHVFLEGNQLRQRFNQLETGQRFVIAETGFGSGLNFLAAWQLWLELRPANGLLHFHSVEKYPLTGTDLAKCHGSWPQLTELAERLQAQYPPALTGVHRLSLAADVHLTLFLGDVEDWLDSTGFSADAWFLDGFSPKQNPTMWTPKLFRQIHGHSNPGATCATFSAAGAVRRGLQEAGFNTEKSPGFGHKRDMTRASLPVSEKTTAALQQPAAAVVGGGLAASMTALALCRRGWKVSIFSDDKELARAASGNPQGAVYVKLAVDWNPHSEYHLTSYLYAIRTYAALAEQYPNIWQACGLLQLAQNPQELQRQEKFLNINEYPEEVLLPVDRNRAEQLAEVRLQTGGLYFPNGGWCRPAQLCQTLQAELDVTLINSSRINRIQRKGTDWQLIANDGQDYNAEKVIICTGYQLPEILDASIPTLPVKPIRGQISLLPVAEETPIGLKTVLCGDGYAMPIIADNSMNSAMSSYLVTGATFQPNKEDYQIKQTDHLENLQKLKAFSPDFATIADQLSAGPEQLLGRTSVRAALPDYFPAIGEISPGLFINLGFGSKGLALTPFAGELIADLLEGCGAPLPTKLQARLSPLRYAR